MKTLTIGLKQNDTNFTSDIMKQLHFDECVEACRS